MRLTTTRESYDARQPINTDTDEYMTMSHGEYTENDYETPGEAIKAAEAALESTFKSSAEPNPYEALPSMQPPLPSRQPPQYADVIGIQNPVFSGSDDPIPGTPTDDSTYIWSFSVCRWTLTQMLLLF